MQEIWKDIPWFDWIYQTSNLWNIRSNKYWYWRILRPWLSNWYFMINLRKNNKTKMYKVHRLVMFSFNWMNKLDVNHKNWIKTDNRIENLEWCNKSENIKHSYDILWRKPYIINKWKFWKLHPKSKKINQYTKDWKFIKTWKSMMDIERELKIVNTSISSVCKNKRLSAGWYKWEYY